jgi:predicted nucleotidyltransferase component of viral defense system
VLILGSIGNIEVGFRQLKRTLPVETQVVQTEAGPLVVPTLDEMICMKAFLAYDRNVTRDYLDFAALTECASAEATLESLLQLDPRYGGLQTASVALEVAKALSAAAPYDLNEADLPHYKGLAGKWHRWEATRDICQRFGVLLGDALIQGGK